MNTPEQEKIFGGGGGKERISDPSPFIALISKKQNGFKNC